jgi:hypothetical protein
VRSAALAAAVVGVVVLPIAAAQASPSHSSAKQTTATGAPATGAPATAIAQLPQYCGATQSGFKGQITAQPCIDDTAGAVTGVVYVGNATGQPVTVAINLTRADGTLAQMQCTIAAHDANGICSTGTVVAASGKGAFDAIAEAVPVGAPLADGVLHVESGQVTPADGAADGAGSGAAAATTSASPAA